MQPDPDGGRTAVELPRRSRVALFTPVAVLIATIALVAFSAWPTLQPVRAVTVTQALFDRSAPAEQATDSPPPSRGQVVQAAGWLEAEPFAVAAAALADGIVDRIEVLEGDRVEAGQVVAHLVDEDARLQLTQAEAALATALAEVRQAEADLRAAQAAWDQPIEAERAVAVGRASLAEGEAELARLPFLIDAARADLDLYQEQLARAEQSLERDAVSELEVIEARQRAAAQRAAVAALEADRPLLAARVERMKAELNAAERNLDLRIAERRALDAATAALERARAEADRARAARDEAALELDRMIIRSPIDGFVQRRLKAPGDKAVRMMDDPTSAQIVIVYDPQRLQARVDVPLADAAQVFPGQRCEVVVEILPDTTFTGQVLRTTHEADLQKNTLQVKVGLDNPSPLLRPEMLTRVKFLPDNAASPPSASAQSRNLVLVPTAAIDEAAGPPRVWTVTARRGDRGVLRAVPVERLGERDGWAAVSGTITPGELLVTGGSDLREGERVRFTAEDPS